MKNWEKVKTIDSYIDKINDKNCDNISHSIPDVYGRVIQYQIFLKEVLKADQTRKTKEEMQWRGIISILALKDYLNLDVKIEKLELTKRTYEQNAFANAVAMTPKVTLNMKGKADAYDWNWNQFYIIQINDFKKNKYIDIALFSPESLIYPVAEIEKKMPVIKEITWFGMNNNDFEKYQFYNPVEFLHEDQKRIVYFWIKTMKEKFNKMVEDIKLQEGSGGENIIINELLSRFENELEIDLGKISDDQKYFSISNITKNLELRKEKSGALDYINCTVETFISINGVKINIHDIFSEKIHCFRRKKDEEMGANLFKHCYFADRHKIRNELDENYDYYAFIPFSKKFLEELQKNQETLKNVMKVFSMTFLKEKIFVHIRFSELENVGINLTHEYDLNKSCDFQANEITTTMWPGTRHENWIQYFIYFDEQVTGLQIESRGIIKEKARENGKVVQINNFPEVISFCEKNGKSMGGLFPKPLKKIMQASSNKEATVCVDFGTSSTIAYAKIENDEEEEMFIDSYESLGILLKSSDSSNTEISKYFIPRNIEESKLYSIYKKFDQSIRTNPTPILDGTIYISGSMEIIPEREDGAEYLTDIKWMNDSDRGWFIAFLTQLCLHISMKLIHKNVGKINWKYAIPLSIKGKNRESIINAWKDTIKNYLEEATGLQHFINEEIISESSAVGSYFYHDKEISGVRLNDPMGYMIIDIGGGSTDFALWKKEENIIMWESSVPVAGRRIFSRQAFQYIHDFNKLLDNDNQSKLKKQLDEISKLDNKTGLAFFERFIEENFKIIKEFFYNCGINDSGREWTKKFHFQFTLGASMIIFAAGQMVGEVIERKEFHPADNGTFYVILAGNGSKLYDWLYYENWNKLEEKDKSAFNKIFMEGVCSRIDKEIEAYRTFSRLTVQIIKSPNPKREVAKGLFYVERNEQIRAREFKKEFVKKEINGWRQKYFEIFSKEFADVYNPYLTSSRFKEENVENKWSNVINRSIEGNKECSHIMLDDILTQYYFCTDGEEQRNA